MSDTTKKPAAAAAHETTEPANDAVPHEAVHDRIQMASVRADGTLDQISPVFIGDKETTLEATKEQFKQQAVSAVDSQSAATDPTVVADAPQDPSIAAAKAEHDEVAAAAESAAEAVVESHFED